MGYRGKVEPQAKARLLRAEHRTLQEIADMLERIGSLTDGEGSKTDGMVLFANTNADMVGCFCRSLRHFFEVDEQRVHWSAVTHIPESAFRTPYWAVADPSIRQSKHEFGCAYVYYCCSRTHREIMGLIRALLSSGAIPG